MPKQSSASAELLIDEHPGQDQSVRITLDRNGRADLVINRPDKHNAFNESVISSLLCGLQRLKYHPRIRVLVLRSEGQHFSAGADLNWMRKLGQSSHAENLHDAGELARLMIQLDEFHCPVIARVQGIAFGGAVGLIACCDIAIGTPSSRFSLSEVRLGLAPAVISPYVNRAIGPRAMRRYTLTAEVFDAAAALQLGLLHRIVALESLDAAISEQVKGLLLNSPAAMRRAKFLLQSIDQQPISKELTELTIQTIADLRVSEDGQEGLSAFLEKRAPAWQEVKDD
jgi:methylglutaconyl-CoA hydratase